MPPTLNLPPSAQYQPDRMPYYNSSGLFNAQSPNYAQDVLNQQRIQSNRNVLREQQEAQQVQEALMQRYGELKAKDAPFEEVLAGFRDTLAAQGDPQGALRMQQELRIADQQRMQQAMQDLNLISNADKAFLPEVTTQIAQSANPVETMRSIFSLPAEDRKSLSRAEPIDEIIRSFDDRLVGINKKTGAVRDIAAKPKEEKPWVNLQTQQVEFMTEEEGMRRKEAEDPNWYPMDVAMDMQKLAGRGGGNPFEQMLSGVVQAAGVQAGEPEDWKSQFIKSVPGATPESLPPDAATRGTTPATAPTPKPASAPKYRIDTLPDGQKVKVLIK